MKKIKINRDSFKKIINKKLMKDGAFVNENKIDKAIKKYLIERDNSDNPTEEDRTQFSEKASKAFGEMSIAINEIIEDLMIIGTTEPDVLVEIEPTEFYSEDYIEELVSKLEEILEAIDYLQK